MSNRLWLGMCVLAIGVIAVWTKRIPVTDGQGSGTPIQITESSAAGPETPADSRGAEFREVELSRFAVPEPELNQFNGKLLIGDPDQSTPFRGSGELTVLLPDSEGEQTVLVESGAFAIRAPSPKALRVVGARLDEQVSVSLSAGQRLVAGLENRLYFTWGERSVEFAVKSRETGEHLEGVNLWRMDELEISRMDPGFGGNLELGPSPTDELVLAEQVSPFSFSVEGGSSGDLWVQREGYVPFQYRFPPTRPSHDIEVYLDKESSITVQVSDPEGSLDRYSLFLLRREAGWKYPKDEEPLRTAAVEAPTRLTGIPPGIYGLELRVHGPEEQDSTVVDYAPVELRRGEELQVEMRPLAVGMALATGHVSIRFPDAMMDTDGPVRATIVPLSANARARGRDHLGPVLVAPGWEWSELELVAGAYYLLREPGQVTHYFEVEPGNNLVLDAPTYRVETSYLTVIDSKTERSITPLSLSMWTSMNWDGTYDPVNRYLVRSFRGGASPTEIHAVPGVRRFSIQTMEAGSVGADVEIRQGVDPVVLLEPHAMLILVLAGLDDAMTLHWLSGAEYTLSGRRIEPVYSRIGGEYGNLNMGLLTFSEEGDIEVRFAPLPSSGSVKSREAKLTRGETSSISIGPADLGN